MANHMARLFAQDLSGRLQPLGLAPAQLMTLLELWEEDGLTQAELIQRIDVEQATMANTLRRMERDGLIHRGPHPHDGRAQRNWLSEKAKNVRGAATNAAYTLNKTAMAALTPQEQETLLHLMRRVIETLRDAAHLEETKERA